MFVRNQKYTRATIRQLLGLPEANGGVWATGHVRHGGEHFIFCGIDIPGRTGQNYSNRFDGDQIVWHPRKSASPTAPVFAELISGIPTIHVFYRSNNRDQFTYAGMGKPSSIQLGKVCKTGPVARFKAVRKLEAGDVAAGAKF